MEITDEIRRTPQYAQYYYQQQKEAQEAAMANQDARRLANWSNTSGYEGQQGQLGLPSGNEALQGQQASGIYQEDFNPRERQLQLRNKAMLGSGLPALQEQALANMGSMQGSVMSGLNQLNLAKYNKANPAKAALPNAYREWQLAQEEGYPGSFMDYKAANKGGISVDFDQGGMKGKLSDAELGELGLTGTYVWGKDGTPKPIKPSTYNDAQMSAAGYAERMYEAENILNDLEAEGFDPTNLGAKMAENLGTAGNYLLNEQQQAMQQARNDWARAKLRDESGAVISEEEIVNEVRTYFPVPGDSPETLKQKKNARRRATKGLARQSGGAYEYVDRPEKQAPYDRGNLKPINEMTDTEVAAELKFLRGQE